MDNLKKRFDDEAGLFDEKVIKSVPFYMEMLGALVGAIPFKEDKKIHVVDLGCGTGTISKMVKERYRHASIDCVDFAGNMLKIDQNKLKGFTDIAYVACDCLDFDFSTGYDAVLSSLALHHIRDEKVKRNLYKKVFKGLNGGGVFYAADIVLGSNAYLQNLNLEKWGDFLIHSATEEEIANRKKRYEEEDHPFKMMDEIRWLEEAGFKDVDVVWKHYHFAVYGGEKKD